MRDFDAFSVSTWTKDPLMYERTNRLHSRVSLVRGRTLNFQTAYGNARKRSTADATAFVTRSDNPEG